MGTHRQGERVPKGGKGSGHNGRLVTYRGIDQKRAYIKGNGTRFLTVRGWN